LIRYRAAWVLPIDRPPLRNGRVAVEGGRIAAVDDAAARERDEVDLGDVALLPGLVNAHTHLELSYLHDRVPPADNFIGWVSGVIASRRTRPDAKSREILDAVDAAIAQAISCGTAAVGDISNTLATLEPLAASRLAGVVFYELIRFRSPDAKAFVADALAAIAALPQTKTVRASLAAHAPYSVGPHVFRAICDALADGGRPCSVHLAESPEEVEFVQAGTGPWRGILEALGSWDPAWVAPAVSPVAYLDACRFLNERTVAVHGVQMTDADLTLLASRGAALVTCPRSNVHTGVGAPPIARFYASGVRVAIGTDSLASAPDLNVFSELAAMRRLAPTVPASTLLDSATRQGALALRLDADFGTLSPGKAARLIAVEIPAGVGDVEEYLVSGIHPDRVRWVGEG